MKKFDHPFIVGLVGNLPIKQKDKIVRDKFNRIFKRSKLPFLYLFLLTPLKQLKNLFICMKMMDVIGATVSQGYQTNILKYLDKIDKTGAKAKKVNTIAKIGKKFVGYYLKDIYSDGLKIWKNSVK